MKQETRTLITYRLERARESLEEASILLERDTAIPLLIVFIMLVFMLFLLCCLQRDFRQLKIVVFGRSSTKTL